MTAPHGANWYTADQIRSASLKDAKQMIEFNLDRSEKFLLRSLLAIYCHQTSDERNDHVTKHSNGVGFTAFDATLLSSFARQVQEWESTPERDRRFAFPLSDNQLGITRKRMLKYASQLARIAQAKQAA